jgi:hypothetical protein
MEPVEIDPTFQKKVIDVENAKLTYYTEKAKEETSRGQEEKLFINMSLGQIMANISRTFIDIINELMTKGPGDLLQILGREDRMIYVGIIILFITFCIYIVDITG